MEGDGSALYCSRCFLDYFEVSCTIECRRMHMLVGISIGCLVFLAFMKACTSFMKAVGDDPSDLT